MKWGLTINLCRKSLDLTFRTWVIPDRNGLCAPGVRFSRWSQPVDATQGVKSLRWGLKLQGLAGASVELERATLFR